MLAFEILLDIHTRLTQGYLGSVHARQKRGPSKRALIAAMPQSTRTLGISWIAAHALRPYLCYGRNPQDPKCSHGFRLVDCRHSIYFLLVDCGSHNPRADHGLRLPQLAGWVDFSLQQRRNRSAFIPYFKRVAFVLFQLFFEKK